MADSDGFGYLEPWNPPELSRVKRLPAPAALLVRLSLVAQPSSPAVQSEVAEKALRRRQEAPASSALGRARPRMCRSSGRAFGSTGTRETLHRSGSARQPRGGVRTDIATPVRPFAAGR